MSIVYADEFVKRFKKLPSSVQARAVKQEALFRDNPTHRSLHIEKLMPKNKQLWSLRVNKKYRIIFRHSHKDDKVFLTIGEHDWVYRYIDRL